jgi:hypothetical protein
VGVSSSCTSWIMDCQLVAEADIYQGRENIYGWYIFLLSCPQASTAAALSSSASG